MHFAQMSALYLQKVLEEYNKEFLTFVQGKENKKCFSKPLSWPFQVEVSSNFTEHLAKLAARQKVKASSSSNSSLVFQRPPTITSFTVDTTLQGSNHNLTPGKAKEEGDTSGKCQTETSYNYWTIVLCLI